MFVRLTNDTTYLTGNEGQKFRAVLSENAPKLERFQLMRSRPFLSLRKMRMRNIFDHVPFCFSYGEKTSPVLCMIRMPPSKVGPQCETIVPLRLKVCY